MSATSDAMPGVSRLLRKYNDQLRPSQVIHCSRCSADEAIFTSGRPFPPVVLKKKFEQKGWYVDGHATRGKHLCPLCDSVTKVVALKEKPVTTQAIHETTPTLAQALNGVGEVRNPTIADKRRINEFLMNNYDSGNCRYVDKWTDHTAATYLHVPRKWVEDIRKDLYGPLAENTEMERFRSDLGQVRAKASSVYDEALATGMKAEKILTELDELRKRLDRIASDAGESENPR